MAKNYEDMTDKEKAGHDKWMARSEKMNKGGKAAGGLGCAAMIIGLVLILLVTIPILFFIL